MSEDKRHGLLKKQGLTQTELAEIEELAGVCNAYEGLDLKLNWNVLRKRSETEANDFLYYVDGKLVGFLPLFSFNAKEGEISGMVHPQYRRQGIFTALFNAVMEECQRRGLPTVLLIVEQASPGGQAFARRLETTYDHSEYKMVLDKPRLPAQMNERLQFRLAEAEDAPMLTRITSLAFDMPEGEVDWYAAHNVMARSDRFYYVGALDGAVIGKLDVQFAGEQEAFIFGFGVLPEYRGKGYGRQILAQTIQELLANGRRQIALEVSTDNKNALSLYQSCGFEETGSYDYYRLPTGK